MKTPALPESIQSLVDSSLAKTTRVHPLPSAPNSGVWIKREDELSSGISGSKLRKYASLLPYLKQRKIDLVAMIGGPNSNNLVGLSQLLRENAIKPIAFIREAADARKQGNALLLDMLLQEDEVRVIPRKDWANIEQIAERELQLIAASQKKVHLLAEGCFGPEGLTGAMTLAEDVLRNESESQVHFGKIYIDCGTGLSAVGLILGLEALPQTRACPREVVVTLIAEKEETFLAKLEHARAAINKITTVSADNGPRIRFLKPHLSPKFGSINNSLFQYCRKIAKEEGIIMDPTYSVKHYAAMRLDLQNTPSTEVSLFIYNGSPLGILGFQEKLATTAQSKATA